MERWGHSGLNCLKFLVVDLFAIRRLGKSSEDLEVKFSTAGQGLRYKEKDHLQAGRLIVLLLCILENKTFQNWQCYERMPITKKCAPKLIIQTKKPGNCDRFAFLWLLQIEHCDFIGFKKKCRISKFPSHQYTKVC